jgi:hypothetical protein
MQEFHRNRAEGLKQMTAGISGEDVDEEPKTAKKSKKKL